MNMLYSRFALLLIMAMGIVGAAISLSNSDDRWLGHQVTGCEQRPVASGRDPEQRVRALVHDASRAGQHDSERTTRNIALRRILPGVLR